MIDKFDIYKLAVATRKRFGESDTSPMDLFAVLPSIEHLSLVLCPMSEKISGICVKMGKDTVIAINSSMSKGRQHFSMAHELYHYYFDELKSMNVCGKDIGTGTENEQKADLFAACLLMPLGDDIEKALKNGVTIEKIIKAEQYYKVSHKAMLKRLLDEGLITEKDAEKYKNNITYIASSLGYDTDLYKPSCGLCKTYGHYIKQVQELYEQELISNGKFEQLLLEAYRADLVYGDEDEEGELND